jgi:hypothetical protein
MRWPSSFRRRFIEGQAIAGSKDRLVDRLGTG